jgi:O-antigen biosynthesis protein
MLEWTGERYIPSVDESVCGAEIHYEHLHRYAFASNFVKGKIVLDLASGEGYGSFFLSHFAESVVGIEIDERSVDHARKRYKGSNLEFKSGSILDIPIAGQKIFDVIVCFEAIEHIQEHDQLISEILRLLKDDGIVILSTPNKKVYSDIPNYTNPFHVKELYFDDLQKMFEEKFSLFSFYGQRTISGSSIFPLNRENNVSCIDFTLGKGSEGFVIDANREILPVYYLVIASNKKTRELDRKKSYLIDPDDLRFTNLHSQLARVCNVLAEKDATEIALRSSINTLNQQFVEKSRIEEDLNSRIFSLLRQNIEQTQTIAEKDRFIDNLESQARLHTKKISELDHRLRENYIHSLSLEEEIEIMKGTILWQIGSKFQKNIIEKTLPEGTKKREKFNLAIRGGRILINKGMKNFIREYSAYRKTELKKIEIRSGLSNSIIEKTTTTPPVTEGNLPVFLKAQKIPAVSIIIPVFNKWAYTQRCLSSLAAKTTGNFEIIVVDDASTDITEEMLEKIKNIHVIRNKTNAGFVESCNLGASIAKGDNILFLNNDTEVTDNWLEPLLQEIQKVGVGAVGGKLIYPDGSLQEAGGIIWADATGWNYGKNEDPLRPEFNFIREVDYCSAAVLIVRKELFEKIGRFDEQFKPGYYEDVDLCFSLRSLGYKVNYRPDSVVIHYEGITSGTNPASGMKRSQEINRDKFLSKWKKELTTQLSPNTKNFISARSHNHGKNILVIDHYVPMYDKDAGSQRMYQLLKILVDLQNNVTFIGENLIPYEPYSSNLQKHGVEVVFMPHVTSIEQYLGESGAFFDIVIISRAHIAGKYINAIKRFCPDAKVIFDTVDLQYLRLQRQAEIENNTDIKIEAEKSKKIELNLAQICNATWVVSPMEQVLLQKEDPSIQVDIVSDIQISCSSKNPFLKRKNILFIGSFAHPPNADAIRWFVKDIFPSIKSQIPGIRLVIIGSDPPNDIQSVADDSIIVTGFVETVEPYLEESRIFIAPVRFGAGIKGKINKSMCNGLPVVTTTIGAEGMYLINRQNALISDAAEGFANHCIELYQNEDLWNELSKNSLLNIENHFSYTYWKGEIQRLLGKISGLLTLQ